MAPRQRKHRAISRCSFSFSVNFYGNRADYQSERSSGTP